ncbi:hypothetical protein JCM10450v2_003449 [Rhodotorula kratochvilovae]
MRSTLLTAVTVASLALAAPSLTTEQSIAAAVHNVELQLAPLVRRQTDYTSGTADGVLNAWEGFLRAAAMTQTSSATTCNSECRSYVSYMGQSTSYDTSKCACTPEILILGGECATCLGGVYPIVSSDFQDVCTDLFSTSSSSSSSLRSSTTAIASRSTSALPSVTVLSDSDGFLTVTMPTIESFDPSVNYFTRTTSYTGPFAGDGPLSTEGAGAAQSTGLRSDPGESDGAGALLSAKVAAVAAAVAAGAAAALFAV